MDRRISETEAARAIFDQFVYADSLPLEEKEDIIRQAISLGQMRAEEIRQEFGSIEVEQFLKSQGITILEEQEKRNPGRDYVKFAEYYGKTGEIHLNVTALEAIKPKIAPALSREIVLSHELYHYFEYKRWGDTSSLFIRKLRLFGRIPVKRRMLPAAEIAANSFTKQLLKLEFEPKVIETYYFEMF